MIKAARIKEKNKTVTPIGVTRNSQGISDFNTNRPCKVIVGGKYRNSGNVFLGFEKEHHKPWRFGKSILDLHPITILEIQGKASYTLKTEKIIAYLYERKQDIPIYRGKGFNGMPNASYIVKIQDLVRYCQEDLILKRMVA